MPSILSAPDILVLGSDLGIAQARAALARELPGVKLAAMPVETPRSSEEAWETLLRATGEHAPAAVFIASHAFSLMLPEFAEGDAGVPVHRTLPPLAEAARLTCTRRVALLAVPETLMADETRDQMNLFAERGLRVMPVSAADLVYSANRYARDGILPDIAALRAFMDPIRLDPRIDSVVLASAHASALRAMLEKSAFRPFYWIDGIAGSVRRFVALRADEAGGSVFGGLAS